MERIELDDYVIKQMLIIILVCCVALFYMEMIYLPHFSPLMYHGEGLNSYDLTLRNDAAGRYIHLQGVLLFALMFLGGRQLIYLLESLKGSSDRTGCIGDYGRYKEIEFNKEDSLSS